MKNIKLNNLIRRFITVSYVLAVLLGIVIGLLPTNKAWMFLTVPTATVLFLFLAGLLNIWVEHRYVVEPFEENVKIMLDVHKKLRKQLNLAEEEKEEYRRQLLQQQIDNKNALSRKVSETETLKQEIYELRKSLKIKK